MMTVEDLTPEALKELLEQTVRPTGANARRRKEFADRFAIQTDDYDYLIRERIVDVNDLSESITDLCRWAVGFFNPQKRIVRRMAVAYKRRPRRRIADAGVDENKKYLELLRKIAFDAECPEWQKFAVAMNRIVILLVPQTDDEGNPTIGFEMVTGAIAEVVREPGTSITSPPGVLCYRLPGANAWGSDPKEPVCVTVDSRWWIWWNSAHQMTRVVEHGMGMFPGADMRSTRPPANDWWDPTSGRGVTSTVAEVGMIAAVMGLTRKEMCRKMVAMFSSGEADDIPDGQTLTHAYKPIIATGSDLQLIVHDLDQAIDNFLKHIKALQDEAAELVTGAVSTLVDPDPEKGDNAGVVGVSQHAAVEEVREGQQLALDVFERRMSILIARMSTLLELDDAIDDEQMREGFRIVWPRLPLLDAPMERVKVWEEETKFGISDQVEAMMEREGISAEEAEERLMEIAERRGRLDMFRAKHSQKADPSDGEPTTVGLEEKPGEDLRQQQGRAGGQASGESRAVAAQ
jgi:hypothetical protein